MQDADTRVSVTEVADTRCLPTDAAALFAEAEREDFELGLDWYRHVLACGMPAGGQARFVVCSAGGRTSAVFPMLLLDNGRELRSLTTPYTCLFAPVLARDVDRPSQVAVSAAFGRYCRRWRTVRLDAMAADWWGLDALTAGLRRARLAPLRFDHFGNWHESVSGLSWAEYEASRPGVLRTTIRRKLRRAEKDPATCFQIVTGADGLEEAIAAFEFIYARSWKEPEPFPEFNAGLIRLAAARGALRLAVMRIGGSPVATQLWIVEHGRASVLKLAHDEAHKPASPGTVLAAIVLRRLIDEEKVTEIDYGRGDDPYKRLWTRDRRQRIGLLIVDPLSARGALTLARQAAAAGARSVRAMRRRRAPEAPEAAPDQDSPPNPL